VMKRSISTLGGSIMMRRILIFIAVLAIPLSLIAASALPARADETPPTLSAVQGPPGTIVKASASDWPGCSSMSVSGWGRTLGTAAINSAGAFSLSFTVPSDAALGATQLQFSPTCTHSTYIPFVTFTVTQGTPPSQTCPTNPTVTFSPGSGPVGTTFTIAGSGWVPRGTVTSTLPYGSPGWFTGYQTPTVDASGGFSYKETVGTGPHGPTPPGTYTITYVEKYGGCSLSFHQAFTVLSGNTKHVYRAMGFSESIAMGATVIGNTSGAFDGSGTTKQAAIKNMLASCQGFGRNWPKIFRNDCRALVWSRDGYVAVRWQESRNWPYGSGWGHTAQQALDSAGSVCARYNRGVTCDLHRQPGNQGNAQAVWGPSDGQPVPGATGGTVSASGGRRGARTAPVGAARLPAVPVP
jgi:hypothetical protein